MITAQILVPTKNHGQLQFSGKRVVVNSGLAPPWCCPLRDGLGEGGSGPSKDSCMMGSEGGVPPRRTQAGFLPHQLVDLQPCAHKSLLAREHDGPGLWREGWGPTHTHLEPGT